MILDNQAIFSDDQDVLTTADVISTNVLDLGAMSETAYGKVAMQRNLGGGNSIPLLLQVIDEFTTGAGATGITVTVQYDDDEAFGTAVDLVKYTFLIADLLEGKRLPIVHLPTSIKGRYLRLKYNSLVGAMTAGSLTAALVAAVDESYQG